MKQNLAKKIVLGFGVGILLGAPSMGLAADSKIGAFLEPAVTYETGETAVSYPAPLSNSTGRSKGFGIGARGGVHFMESMFAGLDWRYSIPKFLDSSVNYDASATSMNWGPVAGLQIPDLGLRVWASYILGSYLDPEESGGFDVKFEDGSGYRVGGGFRVAMVSLNLEYQRIQYAQTKLERLGPFSSGTTFDNIGLDNRSWILSVSFPLEL